MRFTIITVTYNAQEVLPRTLESVKRQTFRSVEHIIQDGASQDNTLLLANAYAKEEGSAKVKVFSQKDKGLYDAMNLAIQKATGDYVVFLNAGDFFPSKDTLSIINNVIEQSQKPLGVVYGDTDVTDDDGNFIAHRHYSAPERLTWRSFKNGMLVCHQAFYAKTSLVRLTPYDLRYRHSADVDWCIRIMRLAEEQGLELQNVNKVIAYYQKEGQTTRYHRSSLMERFVIMRHHYGLYTAIYKHFCFVLRKIVKTFGTFKQ